MEIYLVLDNLWVLEAILLNFNDSLYDPLVVSWLDPGQKKVRTSQKQNSPTKSVRAIIFIKSLEIFKAGTRLL